MKTEEKFLKFKEQEGTDCFLLAVTTTDNYWDECKAMYIQFTPELKKEIKAAHDLFLMCKDALQWSENGIYNISLWCDDTDCIHDSEVEEYDAENLAGDCFDLDNLSLYDEQKYQQFVEVEPLEPEQIEAINEIRTEAGQIKIMDNGFRFTTFLKDTTIEISSLTLPYNIL